MKYQRLVYHLRTFISINFLLAAKSSSGKHHHQSVLIARLWRSCSSKSLSVIFTISPDDDSLFFYHVRLPMINFTSWYSASLPFCFPGVMMFSSRPLHVCPRRDYCNFLMDLIGYLPTYCLSS